MKFQRVRDKITEPARNVATLAITALVVAIIALFVASARLVSR